MAKIIEFYIPQKFQKTVKWIPQLQRGRLIEFPFFKDDEIGLATV